MSKQVIEEIRKAEADAEKVKRAAAEKAAAMRAAVETQGKAQCEEVLRVTENECKDNLDEISRRANRLIERKRAESEKEAAALCEAARAHMDAAVHAVVWGIVEKCQ